MWAKIDKIYGRWSVMVWFDPLDLDEVEWFFRPWKIANPMLPGPEGKELKTDRFRRAVADVMETESSVIANIELPGISKEDVDVNVTDTHITVKADSKMEKEEKQKGACIYSKRTSSFYSSIPLPSEVEADKAKASFKNGLLRVEMPKVKKEVKKGSKVKIE